ncbi:hypothetical protein Gohar_013892 [Gossypium harknessii]|uniref:Uncharacterized protein n=1 Tax=Gossypium harknessii TaxID=34285 RepID=A0A7J9H1I8_9ROSI|nr:hypothetical protein [Gossypium harknessii]
MMKLSSYFIVIMVIYPIYSTLKWTSTCFLP